ncbi:MAG TPA: hypothetical protein VER55_00635 [Ardenticatenaceae bacterium]|nr:hypothetical protein [Ardenticatenaceae bacterium]
MTEDSSFPDVISLPDGFQPEGVAIGRGENLYASSFAHGAIYQADLRTGQEIARLLSLPGGRAMGLSLDERTGHLFVAGGPSHEIGVYDTESGAIIALHQVPAPESFVNDVIVTTRAAYFTDYRRPVLYRVALGPEGQLPAPFAATEIPLSGDFLFLRGRVNSNGIEVSPDEQHLIVVHTALGELYRVDPNTGRAALINLRGRTVPSGDGLLLEGQTLYVVQPLCNKIAVVELSDSFTAGRIARQIQHPDFDFPTTIAGFGPHLYAVNFRDVENPTGVQYKAVRVPKNSTG